MADYNPNQFERGAVGRKITDHVTKTSVEIKNTARVTSRGTHFTMDELRAILRDVRIPADAEVKFAQQSPVSDPRDNYYEPGHTIATIEWTA